jgi:hypothetical protein
MLALTSPSDAYGICRANGSKWPKIALVSASLRCEVRTVGTSSMPKSFATATCPWFGLQGNDCDDPHLVGVLR